MLHKIAVLFMSLVVLASSTTSYNTMDASVTYREPAPLGAPVLEEKEQLGECACSHRNEDYEFWSPDEGPEPVPVVDEVPIPDPVVDIGEPPLPEQENVSDTITETLEIGEPAPPIEAIDGPVPPIEEIEEVIDIGDPAPPIEEDILDIGEPIAPPEEDELKPGEPLPPLPPCDWERIDRSVIPDPLYMGEWTPDEDSKAVPDLDESRKDPNGPFDQLY